jgi:hypothetical protein
MKAATGELNLTVITIIAIGAILVFFLTVLWPMIKDTVIGDWNKSTTDTSYIEIVESDLV